MPLNNQLSYERLLYFHYRIDFCMPKKQKFSYYVLPSMINDKLVGRMDFKADLSKKTLLVRSIYIKNGVKR